MTTDFRVQTAGRTIEDPSWAKFLFNDTRFAWFWAILRIFLGYQWLSGGLAKLSNPAWTDTGVALKGYWEKAVAIDATSGRGAINYDWYRSFIQSLLDAQTYTWFAKLIVFAEVAIGICLIVGAFVGIAAFAGAFMNWNFIMAGTASSNALLALIALLLILAWKTAGWWGLDRFILPRVGVPWYWGKAKLTDTDRQHP